MTQDNDERDARITLQRMKVIGFSGTDLSNPLQLCIPRSVSVAKRLSLRIEQVVQCRVAGELAYIDLEVECRVLATIIEWHYGSSDLVESNLQILLLPLPEDPIEVRMMQVEQWFCG